MSGNNKELQVSDEEGAEVAITPGARRKQKMAKVPLQSLEDFLERMRPGKSCVFCSAGVYKPAPSPKGGTAGVIATPAANIAKVGVWFFAATCSQCGDTRFFHAPQTYDAMASEQGWPEL
ncbi:hypothetical protein [Pseudomonas shirazensis]|uniref:hypothetical protein n=1 Tax=Pseudomonas shirazensis TaxID=2745494 RepID=UPI0016448B7B|nr:hypothetical protein [Pseudomonas shirazensis]MBV4500403.1 hypothetical protein [Pseudomonas shirazensis]